MKKAKMMFLAIAMMFMLAPTQASALSFVGVPITEQNPILCPLLQSEMEDYTFDFTENGLEWTPQQRQTYLELMDVYEELWDDYCT